MTDIGYSSIHISLAAALVAFSPYYVPKLPTKIKDFMDNMYVKMAAIGILGYLLGGNIVLSLIIGAIVIFIFEKILGGEDQVEGIDNTLLILPGCKEVSVAEILDAFTGENYKTHELNPWVQKKLTMISQSTSDPMKRYASIVNDLNLPRYKIDDHWAPYIASQLSYFGFKFGESCGRPYRIPSSQDQTFKAPPSSFLASFDNKQNDYAFDA